MTFQQFQKSWWSWLLFASIVAAAAFYRKWDKLSIILASILVVTGILRLFSKQIQNFAIRQAAQTLAKLPPEQRERELQRLSPDKREEVVKQINGHSG